MKTPIETAGNHSSLYFHIPFCRKKCPYCHFYSIPHRIEWQKKLKDCLAQEWIAKLDLLKSKKIVSIYFGGGTPTLFDDIPEVLDWIQHSNLDIADDCEITIEANPESITKDLLVRFKQCGVNRISIGVQSFDDSSLQILKRPHNAQMARNAILHAADAGFENISIDLMYDLPEQTLASWKTTLGSLPDLPIQHVSLYNLTIEPHTAFFRQKKTIEAAMPQGELSLSLLQMAEDNLEQSGFHRYEISAFAKTGFASRHNCGYWTGRPFLGYGPSAFSYWENKRFQNCASLPLYHQTITHHQSPVDFEETLPYPASVNERLAIHLRLLDGVDVDKWQIPVDTIANLNQLEKEGYLVHQDQKWKLTPRGTLFYDTVAEEIISLQ